MSASPAPLRRRGLGRGSLKFHSQNAVVERPRRTSSRAEACMRSDREGAAWRANPVRIGMGARRVLNTGQLIRSIVLSAAVLVAAVTIALEPAHHTAGDNAPNDRTAWDRARAAASFIFRDERMALDQPGPAALADRARHAN